MAQYDRLRSSNTMTKSSKRPAIAMIELIFAIVIIAISVITIPTMITVADKAAKQITVDDDVMSRLAGWTIDKFQARWDQNYEASGGGPLWISGSGDLECLRGADNVWYRENNDSSIQCDIDGDSPSVILNLGDGNLTNGIEQLNGGSEPIIITPAGGTAYNVTATYQVRYVDSTVTGTNTQAATWVLGSSTSMAPDGSLNAPTHLKRVVTRFRNAALGVDTTLTFFKSNKGN
jgi:Tfp pilus assembly protein FimT